MKRITVALFLAAFITAAGCVSFFSGGANCKSTKALQLSGPVLQGQMLRAETHNGYIRVTGADTAECAVTAGITARAFTTQTAERLVAETRVEFSPSPDALTIRINLPSTSGNESVSVDLDVTVPRGTTLDLASHNGEITVDDTAGAITAVTHNGAITCKDISGSASLVTHNGEISVACKDNASRDMSINATSHNGEVSARGVPGKLKLETYNGGISAAYAATADGASETVLISHNGGIEITPSPALDARVSLSSHNGTIASEIPLAVKGKIGRKVEATVGSGKGSLTVETYNGSIDILEPGRDE